MRKFLKRFLFLYLLAIIGAILPAMPSDSLNKKEYSDLNWGFSISVPSSWKLTEYVAIDENSRMVIKAETENSAISVMILDFTSIVNENVQANEIDTLFKSEAEKFFNEIEFNVRSSFDVTFYENGTSMINDSELDYLRYGIRFNEMILETWQFHKVINGVLYILQTSKTTGQNTEEFELLENAKNTFSITYKPKAVYKPEIPRTTKNAAQIILGEATTIIKEYQHYSTKGHQKSKGVDLAIWYPSSWQQEEGTRPHILKKFTSQTDNETVSRMISITVMDLPLWMKILSDDDLSEAMLSEANIEKTVPAGAELLGREESTYDGERGAILIYSISRNQGGIMLSLLSVSHIFVRHANIVNISCFFTATDLSVMEDNSFIRAAYLFSVLIGNSVVFGDKW